MTEKLVEKTLTADSAGQRLDQTLAELFPEYSRSKLQQWLKDGLITLDGGPAKPRQKVFGGEKVCLALADALALVETENWEAQPIPLDVVYEDEALLVINKPSGLVVHPGAGNRESTLVNALLHYAPELEHVPRAGIIHRIDKETTGLLVIARTLQSHHQLIEQQQARSFEREYHAIVNGVLVAGGTVDKPIGRHPTHRVKMAVVRTGKEAITHYRVQDRFRAHTHLRVQLETGRTHQIRVHMAHLNHPLIGDPLYAGRLRIPRHSSEAFQQTLRGFKRQALHAAVLGVVHPLSEQAMRWEAPLPDDMQRLLAALKEDRDSASES